MATSEQLEREAEATRARIAATLDELRGRMTPGQLVDQMVDYARDSGGGEFVRNFGQQVVGNPLPVTLVGAGLAWLMMAGRRGPAIGRGITGGFGMDDVAEGMSESGRARRKAGQAGAGLGTDDIAQRMSESGDARGASGRAVDALGASAEQTSANVADLNEHAVRRARDWARQTRGAAGQLNERVGAAGANMRDAASSAYDTAAATYDAAAGRAREGAGVIGRGARTMSDNLAATGQGLLGFVQEQPLVLAGIGLALGAILGGALPSTETEDQLVGEASDAAKHTAKAVAEQQVDRGAGLAEQAWNAVKPEIDEQMQSRSERADIGSAGHETGREASLVPSDRAAQTETAADEGARPDSGHSS
jgi:hypothetical protein